MCPKGIPSWVSTDTHNQYPQSTLHQFLIDTPLTLGRHSVDTQLTLDHRTIEGIDQHSAVDASSTQDPLILQALQQYKHILLWLVHWKTQIHLIISISVYDMDILRFIKKELSNGVFGVCIKEIKLTLLVKLQLYLIHIWNCITYCGRVTTIILCGSWKQIEQFSNECQK